MSSPSNRITLFLGSLSIFFAFFIFIHHLDRQVLWVDEGWTMTTANSDFEHLLNRVQEDVHPPLYFIELKLWFGLVGDSVFEMRYFSLMLSLISVAILYRLGTDLYSEKAGFIASVFFITHDLIIVLTQEVRHYSQSILLTCLSMFFYTRFLKTERRRYLALFTLTGAGLLWSHYWGGFALLGLFIHALLTCHKKIKVLSLAYGGIMLLFMPRVPYLYYQITQGRPSGLVHSLPNSWETYKMLVFHLVGVPEVIWLGLAILGCLEVKQQYYRLNKTSLLPSVIIVSAVGISIFLNKFYPVLLVRALVIVVPSMCLLVGYTVSQLPAPYRLGLGIILVAQSLTSTTTTPPLSYPWDKTAEFLVEQSTPADTIIFSLGSTEQDLAIYYMSQSGDGLNFKGTNYLVGTGYKNVRPKWRAMLKNTNSIWLVEMNYPFGDLVPLFFENGYFPTTGFTTWEGPFGNPIRARRWDKYSPEDTPLVRFGDILSLERADFAKHTTHLTVNMLWLLTAQAPVDYTVSVFLLDKNGVLVAQEDSYPMHGTSLTTSWEVDKPYFDNKILNMQGLPSGSYALGLQVYFWNGSEIQNESASDCSFDTNCKIFLLGTVEVD